MDNLYDHLGKTIACSALAPCAPTEMEAVIAPNPRRADLRHRLAPARDTERERLGLLELYSGAPSDDDAIACLGKRIAFRQQLHMEEGAYERLVVALHPIGSAHLEHVLGSKPSPTPEEEELVVSMQGTWKDARRIGRTEEAAQALLTVLRVRGLVVPDAVRERIVAEKDPTQLERAILAMSVDEVFAEAARAA